MADTVYNHYKAQALNNTVDLSGGNIKVALLDSTYTIDKDAHHYWDEVNSKEISGSGYTAGGELLSGKSFSIDDTDDEGVFDASDVTWSNANIDAYYAVVYNSTSKASTSDLVCVFDFGTQESSSNGDFTLQFNSEGVLNLT